MSFQSNELKRPQQYAERQWALAGHVLPYEQAPETLHEALRASALDYFKRHEIKWWTSTWDARTSELEPRPTGHPNSSQVACVNHLEPARVDADAAAIVLANADPSLRAIALEDGFVEYEWIGHRSYLGERGPRTRGANTTSLDALISGDPDGERVLVVFELKYLEAYRGESVARSSRFGFNRSFAGEHKLWIAGGGRDDDQVALAALKALNGVDRAAGREIGEELPGRH